REVLVAREAFAPIQERRLNPDATQGVVASAPETVTSHFGASLARGTGSKPRDWSQQKGGAPRQRAGLDYATRGYQRNGARRAASWVRDETLQRSAHIIGSVPG